MARDAFRDGMAQATDRLTYRPGFANVHKLTTVTYILLLDFLATAILFEAINSRVVNQHEHHRVSVSPPLLYSVCNGATFPQN